MRLIDADKLKKECYKFEDMVSRTAMAFAQGQINAAPTVDIKTEVAREIFAEMKQELTELSNEYREQNDVAGVVYTTHARAIIIKLKNKYIKDGVGE